MGQTVSLHDAEHRLLEMGLQSWQNGLVGATADARIVTFDVPVGSGYLAPSAKVAGGVVALEEELHIHTARCSLRTGEGGDAPLVAAKDFLADRETLTATDEVPMVLMHGYGSGIGIFSAMLPGMAAKYNGAVYAIDTLGCGLSSRPTAEGYWTDFSVRQAEDFFVTGIERWRQAMGFEKINLVGHSIGGYLAVTYAERHPTHVDHVVTIGCAGVPDKPEGFEDKLRSRFPYLAPVAISLWNIGVSPFNVMRWGPGHTFFNRYARRWEGLPWFTEIDRLKDYLHANWTQHEVSAGGYAHFTLLSLAAYARDPLHLRIPNLTLGNPLRMIYGETDWMNPDHAVALRDKLAQMKDDKLAQMKDASQPLPTVEVARIRQGGHNIPLENPTGLVEAISAALCGVVVDNMVYDGMWSPSEPETSTAGTSE